MVYFIQDSQTLAIKIGYCAPDCDGCDDRNWRELLKHRLQNLQVGSSSKLFVLLAIPGDRDDEREYHREFEGFRVRGEWFSPHPKLLLKILRKAKTLGWGEGHYDAFHQLTGLDLATNGGGPMGDVNGGTEAI